MIANFQNIWDCSHLSEEHVETTFALHQWVAGDFVDELLQTGHLCLFCKFCVSQQYVWTLSWQIHKERGQKEGAINKEVLSMHRPILTSFYLIPTFVWNYLKAYSTLLNELLLKNTCSTIRPEQLLKFSPSSFLRKGSCLVSALPGRFGTLIWTVRVTWTDWSQESQ